MIIMFVRHAEDKNDKLTKLGKLQCKMFLKSKETVKFSKIYTSPANRCLQTAKIIQNKWKLPLEITENLNERELLETAEPQNDHEKEWYENYMKPLYSSEKPEGCKDFLTRTFVAFKKIVNEHIEKNENVVIVAHSGILYALSAYINGIKKNKNLTWMRIGNCSKVYFEVLNQE